MRFNRKKGRNQKPTEDIDSQWGEEIGNAIITIVVAIGQLIIVAKQMNKSK